MWNACSGRGGRTLQAGNFGIELCISVTVRLKWAKFIWEEQFHLSCWFSSRTSPISLGWQVLCGLLAMRKHRVPPLRGLQKSLAVVSPLRSTLHPVPLNRCLNLQAVLCGESRWNRLCACQLHSIQEAVTAFHHITHVLLQLLLESEYNCPVFYNFTPSHIPTTWDHHNIRCGTDTWK